MPLEPIEPEAALRLYLDDKRIESAESTIRSHRSRLRHFTGWCDEQTIGNMNVLTARKLHEFRIWRRSSDGKNPNNVTMKTQMDTLRVFIRWCESIDAVEEGLAEKVLSPDLDKHENEKDELLDPEVGDEILGYLRKYRYGTREHVVFVLIWRCLLRRGGISTIDTGDLVNDDGDDPHVKIRHQPETGTPLKKKADGERRIALKADTVELIEDYIEATRDDVTDEHGREPLLTTASGRPHLQTLQSDCYAVTRPCIINGGECPHERDPDECSAAVNRTKAYECPSSRSPHAVRRGAITRMLSKDVPKIVVSDRASTSKDVLDKHYDERSERQKMSQRRDYLSDI